MADNLNIIAGTVADRLGETVPVASKERHGVHTPTVDIGESGNAAKEVTLSTVAALLLELLVEQRITNDLINQAFNVAPEGVQAMRDDPAYRPVLNV